MSENNQDIEELKQNYFLQKKKKNYLLKSTFIRKHIV